MAFLSDLIGQVVRDADGQEVGKLADLLVPVNVDYPAVVAVAVRRPDGQTLIVPWEQVELLDDRKLRLRVPIRDATPYQPTENDLFLASQVLDRQIIDVNGTRVVRANDLQLTRTNGLFRLVSVDISTPGLLRRLGVEAPIQKIVSIFGLRLPHTVIAWHDIDPVETGPLGVRLRIPAEDLAKLHPADIAAIVSQLDQYHAEQAIQAMDAERAADTIEEFAPDLQTAVIEAMDADRAADILEEMDPDEAADILADIPQERKEAILERMEPEEAQDVRELLGYPENSAGGIMTTDFVTIPPHVPAEEAIRIVRAEAAEIDNVYYVYVTDAEERLLGALSLRELIVAPPDRPVSEIMHRDIIAVHVMDSQEEAARLIAKYNFLALPVVDDEGRLHGIVTVDDAMDIILPVAWKKRLPRIFH